MATFPINSHIVNAEVYLSGTSRLLGIANVDLMEIKLMTNETKGVGIGGVINVPSNAMFESLELKITWRTINDEFVSRLAFEAHDLDIYAAEQVYENSVGELRHVQEHFWVRALPIGLTLGKFEPSAETDSELTLEVVALRYFRDGTQMIDIDKTAYKFEIGSDDWSRSLRRALALE